MMQRFQEVSREYFSQTDLVQEKYYLFLVYALCEHFSLEWMSSHVRAPHSLWDTFMYLVDT